MISGGFAFIALPLLLAWFALEGVWGFKFFCIGHKWRNLIQRLWQGIHSVFVFSGARGGGSGPNSRRRPRQSGNAFAVGLQSGQRFAGYYFFL